MKLISNIRNNIWMILSFIISLIIVYYRRPDAFLNSQFWGEEGSRFFTEAYQDGFNSLFNTCNGYFHLFPRLVACITRACHFPLEYIPIIYCYSWLLILFLVLFYIWTRLSFSAIRKFFIALAVTLIPIQSEIIMNLTNVQWIMALFPLVIFSSYDNTKNKNRLWLDIPVLILSGLTGPNFTVLLPVFIWMIYKQKKTLFHDSAQLILYLLPVFIGVISAVSIARFGSIDRSEGEFTLMNPGFIKLFFLQYAFVLGGRHTQLTPVVPMMTYVALIIVTMYFLFRKAFRTNVFGFISLSAGILFFIATAVAYRYFPETLSPYDYGVRNFYLPFVTFTWGVIAVLPPGKATTVFLTLLMIIFTLETTGIIGRQRFTDYKWKEYAQKIPVADTLTVPINPPGWFMFIDNGKKR